jgi:hypothetical protein
VLPPLQDPAPSLTPKAPIPVAIPASVSAPMLSSSAPPPIVLEPSKKTPHHPFSKGFEFSLDLMSATKGNYVIKPQVIKIYVNPPSSPSFNLKFFELLGRGMHQSRKAEFHDRHNE